MALLRGSDFPTGRVCCARYTLCGRSKKYVLSSYVGHDVLDRRAFTLSALSQDSLQLELHAVQNLVLHFLWIHTMSNAVGWFLYLRSSMSVPPTFLTYLPTNLSTYNVKSLVVLATYLQTTKLEIVIAVLATTKLATTKLEIVKKGSSY